MIPIVILIGRTNVGKSTLFNLLTKTRNALVSYYPGITRDRQYGYIKSEKSNQKIVIIDTAGLDINHNEIEKKAYKQTLIGIEKSDIILFLVSASEGLMPQDLEIVKKIRRYEKKIILVINKTDTCKDHFKINEFYSLGIENIQKISASHNQGINLLIDKHLIPWIDNNFYKNFIDLPNIKNNKLLSSIKVAFVGKPNVGKSTLINSLLKEERMITSSIPGTTLDSISTNLEYNFQKYTLIDTAGASKKKKIIYDFKKYSIIKTFQSIEKSNVTLLIIDASSNICNQDLFLADFIINSGRGIVIIFNKWDLLDVLEKKKIKNLIRNSLKFLSFARIHFISALYKKGIFALFKSIYESYEESKKKISTSVLTKTMQLATKKHQPPIIKRNRIKLKYAHLGNSNPPKIIIHGNQVEYLSSSYKRYLNNFFYNHLNIKGTPIQIEFKNNINPYINNKKKNKR